MTIFSDSVVNELARVWAQLHRSAAEAHLKHFIRQMQLSGDREGVINYGHVLRIVRRHNDERGWAVAVDRSRATD